MHAAAKTAAAIILFFVNKLFIGTHSLHFHPLRLGYKYLSALCGAAVGANDTLFLKLVNYSCGAGIAKL